MIGLVWAQSANGVIGNAGALPWQLPEDLAHFRELTRGATVVMGRRTWDSLSPRFRPLPGRRNIVLTRDPAWAAPGAESAHRLDAALRADAEVWVIGGAEVYRAALAHGDRAIVTELREPFAGDCRAPVPGPDWRPVGCEPAEGWHESRTGLGYRFRTWRRS